MFELHDWVNMQSRAMLQDTLNCIASRVRAAWVSMPNTDFGSLRRWSSGIKVEMVRCSQIPVRIDFHHEIGSVIQRIRNGETSRH